MCVRAGPAEVEWQRLSPQCISARVRGVVGARLKEDGEGGDADSKGSFVATSPLYRPLFTFETARL